jgi:hypothetical protein
MKETVLLQCGGWQAWTKIKSVGFECDNGTEQNHEKAVNVSEEDQK